MKQKNLKVRMPKDARRSDWTLFFQAMGSYLCCDMQLDYLEDAPAFDFRLEDRQFTVAWLPFEHVCKNIRKYRPVEPEGQRWTLLVRDDFDGGAPSDQDFLSPLLYSFALCERSEDLRRDHFGLVEGKNSYRHDIGMMERPLVEHAWRYIAEKLGMEATHHWNGRQYAVGVSCDIDDLQLDHMDKVVHYFQQQGVDTPTFFLYARHESYHTIRDPEYDLKDPNIQKKLAVLRTAPVEVGMHGGYIVHDQPEHLRRQKELVEDFLGKPVVGYRTHFLRMNHPRTFIHLMDAGFEYDSSIGYSDIWGLGNAISCPHAYRHEALPNKELKLMPMFMLDQHFHWPEELAQNAQLDIVERYMNEIALVGGCLVADFHTYTMESQTYPNWWDSLHAILQRAKMDSAVTAGLGTIQRLYTS